jgi:histidinol-phosphate phosphatase family protein
MRQAVVLAGGRGTRLRQRLNGRPKPLVDVDGVPLLGRQLRSLREYRFTAVVILVNYGADQIAAYCANPDFADLRICLLDDGAPRGTAGALLQAIKFLDEKFLVVYGDTLFEVNLDRLWSAHSDAEADVTILVHPNDHPFDSDLIEVNDGDWITAFHRYPHDPEQYLSNLVNAAMYVVDRRSIEFWHEHETPSDIARDLFPASLCRGARLKAYRSFEYIKDIGTPERLDKAIAHLRRGLVARAELTHKQRAVFLDRDGTINELRGHIKRAEDLVLIEGVAAAVKSLNEAEYRVVVITNQPVIARGECSLAELRRIHGKIENDLGAVGAFIDRFYFCPHHPDRGYEGEITALKTACSCRKPATGLIDKAYLELNIEHSRSWFIGDSTSDMLAARRAGLRSVLVRTGEGGRDGKYPVGHDFEAENLFAAVAFIVHTYPKMAALLPPLCERIGPGDIILIGGLARQGKSTFASVLRSELVSSGRMATVLSLDCFIRNPELRQTGVLGRYDLDEGIHILAPWLSKYGKLDVLLPSYDRIERRRLAPSVRFRLALDDILIVEGVPALALQLTTNRRIVRVYLDGEEGTRKQRVVGDFVSRYMTVQEAEQTYESRSKDETPVISNLASQAHFVLNLDSLWLLPARNQERCFA